MHGLSEHVPPLGRLIFDRLEEVRLVPKYGRHELVLVVHEHKNSALRTAYVTGTGVTGKAKVLTAKVQ